jgi:hypothetical protein
MVERIMFDGVALTRIGYLDVIRDGGSLEGVFGTSSGSLLTLSLQCRRGSPLPAESAEPTHAELYACLDAVDRCQTIRSTDPIPKSGHDEHVLLRMLRDLLSLTPDPLLASLVSCIELRVDRER